MRMAFAVVLLLTAQLAAAQEPPDFLAANKSLSEQSYTRACDGFGAFLKAAGPSAPLTREAQAKKAWACSRVGKGGWDELYKLATQGEKDFARAWAAGVLWGEGNLDAAQAQAVVEQAAGEEGRRGAEARALLVRAALQEMGRYSYDLKRVDRLAEVVLRRGTAAQQAQARYFRANTHLQNQVGVPEAEKELMELGSGTSDLADDALYLLAQRRESERKYPAALELYDGIVKRFSPVTSNVRSNAESQAREIRRPQVSISSWNNDFPGVKPTVQVSWRNVRNARWQLKKVDPLAAGLKRPLLSGDSLWAAEGTVASTWTSTLDSGAPFAPGSTQLDVEVREPGLYALHVDVDGQTANERLLVSSAAVLTKTDRDEVVAWAADIDTGVALPGARFAAWQYLGNGEWKRWDGQGDALGLWRQAITERNDQVVVWAHTSAGLAFAQAGHWYGSSYSKEELAYVQTDRPLYKPGETVGLKVYLRTRHEGPTQPIAERTFTLEIYDPTGKRVAEPSLTTNAFGTATYTLPLPKGASLGAWRAQISSSPTWYRQDARGFRVEEYKPPEYTVSVEPLGTAKPGEAAKFKVKASYYSGGAVANAQGRALVQVLPWTHAWGPWPGAAEDDPATQPDYDEEYGYRGRRRSWYGPIASHTLQFKTGADGTAEVEVPAFSGPMQVTDGLQLQIQVFVTDASRREISGAGSVRLSHKPWFVDLKPSHFLYRPGEKVALALRAEDANGRPASPDVVVRLVRLKDDGTTGKVAETRTSVAQGKGAVMLDADALGRVRAEVVDAAVMGDGAPVLAQTDLWLTSDTKPIPPPGPGFQLIVDRAPLAVGQGLRALVVTDRPGGHALVTIEHEALVTTKVVELQGRAKFVELPLPPQAAPNAWFWAGRFENALFRHQHLPITVRGSEVQLDVKVALGKGQAEPGQTVPASIAVTGGPAGAQTETALTVVDEALFAIEPERKDFLTYFAGHRRNLTVRTASTPDERSWRIRPQKAPQANAPQTSTPQPEGRPSAAPPSPIVAESLAGASRGMAAPAEKEEARKDMSEQKAKRSEKSAMADDEAGPADNNVGAAQAPIKARTNFSSSSGWFPTLAGTIGGALAQPIKLTDSLTSWKAIATVVSKGPHLGEGASSLRTSKPLMVRLQAPRFFVEGDEVVLSAVVESHLDKATEVAVAIAAPGFKPLGPSGTTVMVKPNEVQRVDARFKVVDLGDRVIRATARAGGASDAMEWTLPAFVHGSAQRQFFAGRFSDRNTVSFEVPGKRKAALTRLELTLSPSLLAVMLDGLPYLAQYPYGCVEQTLSRFVPAVIARRAVKELGLPQERVPAELDDMVGKGLERLYTFQHSDGGWGWWQADNTNRWMTAYVVASLSLAKEAGLEIRPEVITRGRAWLTQNLGAALGDPETHAYMVYALTQSGGAPKAALDTLYGRRTTYSAKGRALVALALLTAKDARARVAVENLDDVVKAAQARQDASVGEANDAWSTSQAIEATALTLMAMTRYDLKSPLLAPLADFLVLRRNGGKWRTTRDTAFAIYALSELARREGAALQSGSFVVLINGKEVKRVPYAKGGLDLGAPLVLGDAALQAGKNQVELRRDGGGTGYWGLTLDIFNQDDFIKGVGGDVKVKRTYTLLGRPNTEPAAAPTEYGMPVESGYRVRVDLEVTANKAVEFVMVEDLKPAGFEAVAQRSGPEVCNYACAHAELRTDRVAMFLSQVPVGTTKLSYELRAEVPGKFSGLPARVEAMYAPEIQATADEMRFEVRDAPVSNVARP